MVPNLVLLLIIVLLILKVINVLTEANGKSKRVVACDRRHALPLGQPLKPSVLLLFLFVSNLQKRPP